MAEFSVNATRIDPYKNFKFKVKWDGKYVAGVSKVSAHVGRAVLSDRISDVDKSETALRTSCPRGSSSRYLKRYPGDSPLPSDRESSGSRPSTRPGRRCGSRCWL